MSLFAAQAAIKIEVEIPLETADSIIIIIIINFFIKNTDKRSIVQVM